METNQNKLFKNILARLPPVAKNVFLFHEHPVTAEEFLVRPPRMVGKRL